MRFVPVLVCLVLLPGGLARADTPPAIVQPQDGATLTGPVKIVITPGTAHPGTHLHLIVDAPLPAAGSAVPMDAHHVHLVHGETEKTLTLAPGRHKFQLIEGSMAHGIAADAPHSEPVTVEVK